jgi:hypothetical protein
MKHEILELPHGYTAEIHIDESPENPFEAWDGEPPIATFSERRIEYPRGQDPLDISVILSHIPSPMWGSREGKRAILAALPFDMADLRDTMKDGWGGKLAFKDAIRELADTLTPDGWREAEEYFDAMEALCKLAGIACYSTISNGYSQGDSARVFVAALPAWVEEVGAPADMHAEQCKAAAALWGAWAWGDVYGVAEILDPEGREIGDGSCWGFYGRDHEASGLMEHCTSNVRWHIAETEKETARAFEAACRDIETAA